jgi:phage shock protein PspC (stress-responsive transcriptional regulator)
MEKKLQRDENNKMIGGVAAGLAEYFDVDITWVRLGFILAVLAGLSGILAYIVLWIAVPAKPFNPYANVTGDYKVYEEKTFSQPFSGSRAYTPFQPVKPRNDNGRLIGGTILIIIGGLFLFRQFHLLPFWVSFHKLWPLALIIPGIMLLIKSGDSNQVHNPYTPPQPPAKEQSATESTNTSSDQPLTN